MRKELEYIQIIEQYLAGELSSKDHATFESRLASNTQLQEDVAKQKLLKEGIQRSALVSSTQKGLKSYKKIKTWKAIGLVSTVIIAATVSYFVWKNSDRPVEKIGSKIEVEEQKNVEDLTATLPSTIFEINTKSDTVIETENGLVFVIPQDGFETLEGKEVNGDVTFKVKEAFDELDIMQAGLSTTSNGELLETGGMFFLEASHQGKELRMKKGKEILAQLPNLHPEKNMMLFDGEKDSLGNINWINPKKFDKDLLTLDITTLDFYPEGYVDELNTVRTKTIHDSLYYEKDAVYIDSLRKIRKKIFDYPKSYTDSVYYSYARLFKKSAPKKIENITPEPIVESRVVPADDNYDQKRDIQKKNIKDVLEEREEYDEISCPIPSGINPAKVKAIWNKKFNKTILATHEFEERMKVIHQSRQDWILQVYVRNINKPLWYSDSIVARKTGGNIKKEFTKFFEERKGGVKISDRLTDKLSDYFNNKQKEFTAKSAALFEQYEEEKRKLRKEFRDKKNKKSREEILRKLDVFNGEYNLNLCEAYKQLGKRGCRDRYISREKPLRIKMGLGPKNIDAYVYESTRNRTTLDYTDPNSGAKAVIKYQTMKVEIMNKEKFDQVFVYLIPDSLSSFNRMKSTDNIHFELALNELLHYKLVCIAYLGDQVYYDEMRNVEPKEYKITLFPSSKFKVRTLLRNNSSFIEEQIKSDQEFYSAKVTFERINNDYLHGEWTNLRIGKFLFPSVDERCLVNRSYEKH